MDAILCARPAAVAAVLRHRSASAHLHAIGAAFRLVLLNRVRRGPVTANGDQLRAYLSLTASHDRIETVRVLYLNSRHELIRDDLLASGTPTDAPFYPRAILKRALELDADGFLIVHNHPSGDPTPSRADKELTVILARGAKALGILLLDHVIVSRGAWLSFREQMLL